ncbi:amidohydrolase [Alkalihalobacillus sp. R86527]|uniref:amidohydrolase n=1 Tax=Alkalihalobacillus sp. R86527 TaxID=3093863 RepID=UPI00366F02B6
MIGDLVFINGEVWSLNSEFSIHEAAAVKGNRILMTGRTDEVMKVADDHTEIIDLKGRSLLPGFIDAHAHLELYGTNKLGVNCKDVAGIDDLLEKLKVAAERTPEGEWVRGWGYNQNELGRHLTKWDLDKVSVDHPIIVVRTCGHISCVNSHALELGGVTNNTQNPVGGKYAREENEVSGLLLESAHMNMFLNAMYSEEEIQEGLMLASQDFIKNGITSVHDAGGYGTEHIRALQRAVNTGAVKQRVYALYGSLHQSASMVKNGLASGMVTGLGDQRFRIGPAKVFIDGSSSGPTAKTREPYTSDKSDSGILYLNQEELNKSLVGAHEQGWQITAHAIGDEAVEMMIETIETGIDVSYREDHRHRIEHAAIAPGDLVKRIKASGIAPIPNPAFLHEFGDGYIRDYGERTDVMFPLKDFVDHDIPFSFGSDSPITDVNPFVGIYAAVNRRSKRGHVVGESQRISIEEAIKAYTLSGAYASFEENLKGSIEKGKLADLVVISESILHCKSERLKELKVDMTVLDGEIVFVNKKEGVK